MSGRLAIRIAVIVVVDNDGDWKFDYFAGSPQLWIGSSVQSEQE